MSSEFNQVKVLEQCRISPPPNSVPTTTIPLTFLDILWLFCCPIQRVFFYQVPFSVTHFTEEILPQLKKSLSLALELFFPFCGNTVSPPQPSEPYIVYKDGDSVPLLIALSTGNSTDFLRDEPRDAKEIRMLVPPAPQTRILDDTLVKVTPLLTVQVTLFPNSALCIGITFCHGVADGTSFNNFVKTWSSIFNANSDISSVSISLPVYDKSVIKDPNNGIKDIVLGQWRSGGCPTGNQATSCLMEDSVRATFTLSRAEIDRLKKWVSAKCDSGMEATTYPPFSTYVVTSAFIWACLIKSLNIITPADDSSGDEEMCHFAITANIRNKYDLGIPLTYFGNCLAVRFVALPRSTFQQANCVATAAEAIRNAVQRFKQSVFDEYEFVFPTFAEAAKKGEFVLTLAGSPSLAAYDTDFGWGRPAKTEVVHVDVSGAISLNESRKGKGGIEVGLCQRRQHMDAFTSFFQAGVNQCDMH